MRALLQRVRQAAVEVDGREVGAIASGLVVFLGIGREDTPEDAQKLSEKTVQIRIFPDEKHSMNRSLEDVGGEILLVSQFTLYADCRKGRRPSFEPAEAPERAQALCQEFAQNLEKLGYKPKEGVFGAHMAVRLENDGPVTILLET
jgi:D-tyrosyl-tRNA(Tyr) deacylase